MSVSCWFHFFYFFLMIKFEVADDQIKNHLGELASYLQGCLFKDDMVGKKVLVLCFQLIARTLNNDRPTINIMVSPLFPGKSLHGLCREKVSSQQQIFMEVYVCLRSSIYTPFCGNFKSW